LADEISALIDDPGRLQAIGAAAAREGERHRGDSLIDLIVEVART
jgi:hypothetical protein